MDDRPIKVIGVVGGAFSALALLVNGIGWHLGAGIVLSFAVAVSIAALYIYENDRAEWLEQHLDRERYSPLYRMLMRAALGWVGPFFGIRMWRVRDRRSIGGMLRRTWSYALVDRALLLAVIYPLLLVLASWSIAQTEVTLGAIPILGPPETIVSRITLLLSFSLLIASILVPERGSDDQGSAPLNLRWVLFNLCLATNVVGGFLNFIPATVVAITIASALPIVAAGRSRVAGGAAMLVAVSGAASFAIVGAVVGSFGNGVASLVGGGVAVIAVAYVSVVLTNTIDDLANDRRFRLAAGISLFAPVSGTLALVMLTTFEFVGVLGRTVFLFLAVIPLMNGLFDILSYGVTLSLTQLGLRLRGAWAFVLGVADIIFALVSLIGLATALVLLVTWMERVTGVEWIDLGGMLADLGNWERYGWVYFMMFSTLVPTLIHLLIACFALQSVLPGWLRSGAKTRIVAAVGPQGTLLKGASATLWLATLWWLSLAIPAAVIVLLSWATWVWIGEALGGAYVDWLLNLAARINAI